MLSNLRAEMVRAGVSVDDMAAKTGKSCRTIRDRLKGKVMFPIDEAFTVRNAFFPRNGLGVSVYPSGAGQRVKGG